MTALLNARMPATSGEGTSPRSSMRGGWFRNRAVAPGMKGRVWTRDHGAVTLHTYIAPEDGLLVNTPIIEGPRSLVIFDSQFLLPYAWEAARFAESLDKPVECIGLSHIHLDHWAGLGVLKECFPDAPIRAPSGVTKYLRAHAQSILDGRRRVYGDLIPAHPTIPTEALPDGRVSLAGVNIEISAFADAESAAQMVVVLPEQRTLLAFDLAFAPNEHVFTVTSHFSNWMGILRGLGARTTFDDVISGHGTPTGRAAIGATIEYLEIGKATFSACGRPEDYAGRMKLIFSERQHPEWIDLSAMLLYEVIGEYAATR